jgi:hypothetical protein
MLSSLSAIGGLSQEKFYAAFCRLLWMLMTLLAVPVMMPFNLRSHASNATSGL